jgi:sulfhydrogenase subunit gamma (sulfur reductase)
MSIYYPTTLKVTGVTQETPDIVTLEMAFLDESYAKEFSFRPGQFGLLSAFGEGEAAFAIASSPLMKESISCSIKKIGKVTNVLSSADVGDVFGFRGPYGNWFPLEDMKGKKLLFVAGGIGFSAVRSSLLWVLEHGGDYGDITLLYGARSVQDLVYKRDLEEYGKNGKVRLLKTVDPGGEAEGWDGKVGFVPTVLEEMKAPAQDTAVIVCGPPIMIKLVIAVLVSQGFDRKNVYTTLESRMKCGLGKCGRCNIGKFYVCRDGPVFTAQQIADFPPDY